MDQFDPDHHLERRPDGYWLSITLHGQGRPRRLRKPLHTRVRRTARRRRDALLRRYPEADRLRRASLTFFASEQE